MLTSVVHVLHNSAQDQKGAASRFRRHTTPSIPPPRDLPRPPWPARCGRFLIANPRLEILASPTKQTIGARPNRDRIAFPSPALSPHLRTIEFRPEISNSNIPLLRIHLNAPETTLTHFLTATKCTFRRFASFVPGSPRLSSTRIQSPADCPPPI